MTKEDNEIVELWFACESLDSLVNHVLLSLSSNAAEGVQVSFKTATHQRLFNILLIDFLCEKGGLRKEGQRSCLEALEGACQTASFNKGSSVEFLREPVVALRAWLAAEITVPSWFPSVGLQLDLRVRRLECIHICGNISKHNPMRLTGAAKKLCEILARQGARLCPSKSLLLLKDFYERFHSDIFNYQSTAIIELLNDVRWGIHNYLMPVYVLTKIQDDGGPVKYTYKIPGTISDELSKYCYWELMNSVRQGPHLKPFIALEVSKRRY